MKEERRRAHHFRIRNWYKRTEVVERTHDTHKPPVALLL